MSEWTSVNDDLPELREEVLVYSEKTGVTVGTLIAKMKGYTDVWSVSFKRSDSRRKDVTHWQSLPKPPQED